MDIFIFTSFSSTSFKVKVSPALTPKSWAALSVKHISFSVNFIVCFLFFISLILIIPSNSSWFSGTIIWTFSSFSPFTAVSDVIYIDTAFFISLFCANLFLNSCLSSSVKLSFKLICISYINTFSNWFGIICFTESFTPKPVKIKAVQPKIPIIVIKNLFLYLNIFLTVTLWLKFSLFQINGIFSIITLFPPLGALGLISTEGVLTSSFKVV